MPKTRRKSLSFREVESFLTEISTVTNDINKSVDNFFQFDDVDGSNYQLSSTFPKKMETAKRSDADLIREFCKVMTNCFNFRLFKTINEFSISFL